MKSTASYRSRSLVITWLLFFLLSGQIMAPVALAQSTKPKQSAEDYFDEGEKLLEAAKYEEAIDAYSQAIELDAEYAEAYQQRGEAYRMISEYRQALKDLNRAIKLNPDVYLAYATRGATLKEMGRYEDALEDFDEALALEKDGIFALANRGHTYYYLGEYEAALEDMDHALDSNPEYRWALVVRAQIHRDMENYDKAVLDLTRAIALDPEYDWAYATRGETHRLMGSHEEALADLDRALELNADYTYALAIRGKTYEDLEQYDEALADFDRALELDPEYAWVLAERGYVYRVTERYEEAIADFDQALELDDANDWAYAQRGLTYQSMEEYKKALADFNEALDLDPKRAWYWALRADLYRIMERYDDALADSDEAIALDQEYDFAWGVRGYIYRQTEQYEEAIDAFSQAIELSPDYTWAYTMRGEVYQLMGRDKEALADFNEAAKLNGEEPITELKNTPDEDDKTAPKIDDNPSEAMSSREDAAQAIIRIETVGSFVAPDKDQRNVQAGSGSGFIIDPSGIAVTNNHVVTGAALLKVYVPGYNRALNARVLGVSECADLAVIDIEGDGFPYLSWHETNVAVGLDVFAAGYPLGDPEFTLTRGIVSKEHANGQTRWSSLESVLQHDATINPGNSGGPLIDGGGQVVGVNYAGNSEFNQYFAIPGSIAIPLIEQLREGDIDTLGINGEAMSDGESFSGIWVYSVKSGSPADQAGIQGGDFILTLEKLPMAADGTMRTYCDVVRSHSPEDTLNVEIVRLASNEMCTGQINGRPLTCAAGKETPQPTENGGEMQAVDLRQVQHEDGQFAVSVPADWTELTSSTEEGYAQLIASSKSGSAGTVVTVFTNQEADPDNFEQALDEMRQGLEEDSASLLEGCEYGKRDSFKGDKFQGAFDQWTNCDSGKNSVFTIILMPTDGQAFFASFIILWPAHWELSGLDEMLDSLTVNLDAAPAPAPPQPAALAVVVVETNVLNVRSGPGTNYGVLGQLERGARLAAVAQAYNCTWFQVQLPNGQLGWVAGTAPYSSLEGNCANLPQGQIPAPPKNSGNSGGGGGNSSGGSTGCIFFQNHFNDEATVTLNKKDGSWNKTFKIGRKANHRECLAPGDYTYTVDVPPPWDSINGDLTIVRGRTIDFPIYGEHN